jgi:hypothetical protein
VATLEKLDGWEHGRTVTGAAGVHDNGAGTVAISTTTVRTGLRSVRFNPSAAASKLGYTVAGNIVTASFYVWFATLPTNDTSELFLFANATSGNGRLLFDNTTGKLELAGANFAAGVQGGPVLATGQWYRVTIEYDTSATPAVLRCIVDGGTEFTNSSNAITPANSTSAAVGSTSTSSTYDAFFDDWILSITNGDYEEISTWASHEVESLIPTADGTHNIGTSGDFDSFTGTAFSNATTNGHTFIGHRPLQAANTADQVIRQELGTTAHYMEHTLGNLTDNTKAVAGVRAYATHVESASAGASLGEARLLLSDGTVVLTIGSIDVINSTEDPGLNVTIRKRMTIPPSGGWDGTKVDGLKARIGFADNAPDVNFIDFMVEVAQYEEAAAAEPTRVNLMVVIAALSSFLLFL